MIDHTKCDHPRTSGARAKCRRGQDGSTPKTKKMGKAPRESGAGDRDDNYGQTPRERWMECDNCGVERIAYRGTDPLTNVVRYVGPKCKYTIQHSPDLEVLPY